MDNDGLGRVTKVDLRTVWGPDSHPRNHRTQVVDPTGQDQGGGPQRAA